MPIGTIGISYVVELVRYLLVGADDVGDVLEVDQLLLIGSDQHVADRLDRGELAGGLDAQVLVADQHLARIRHHVLRLQDLGDGVYRDAQLAEAGAGHLHIDDLFLLAADGYLAHPGHQHQLALDLVGKVPQVAPGIALAGEGRVDAVDVAEVVDDHRAARPRGELVFHVGDLAAQLVVDIGEVLGAILILELDQDVRHARPGDGRLDVPHLLHALDRILDVVSDLVLDLLGGGPGVKGDDLGQLDGEGRVLQLAHVLEAPDAAAHHDDDQQPGGDLVLDRKLADIHDLPLKILCSDDPQRWCLLAGARRGLLEVR